MELFVRIYGQQLGIAMNKFWADNTLSNFIPYIMGEIARKSFISTLDSE
jgi:hypothetical protein